MRITEAMMQTSITEERNRLAALYRDDVTCLQAALGPDAAQDMIVEIHAELTADRERHTAIPHAEKIGVEAKYVLDKWTERAIDAQMSTFDPWADARERMAEQST